MDKNDGFIRAASLAELKGKGLVTVRGADRPIVIFAGKGDEVFAVDNRCPHMGFPLNRGTCDDGMITCPWHNARFDGASGCTFDLFADDVPAFDVEVRGGEVWVAAHPRKKDVAAHARRRLREGMEQNVSLVCNKAIIVLSEARENRNGFFTTEDTEGAEGGANKNTSVSSVSSVVKTIALYGARYRDNWGPGLTVLTAVANLLPHLSSETALLALFQAAERVAGDCAGRPPRRDRYPLDDEHGQPTAGLPVPHSDAGDLVKLKRWLRYWAMVRHRDAAERTLLTAIEHNGGPRETAALLFTALTDRAYGNIGHPLDFSNKAFELLGHIGHEHTRAILPTVVADLCSARGGEESNAWRHPIDLIALLQPALKELPALLEEGRSKRESTCSNIAASVTQTEALAQMILSDDPRKIIAALVDAIRTGAQPAELSLAVAYAASLRIARFGMGNEIGDWFGVQHTFTYCNALHQAIKRQTLPLPPPTRGRENIQPDGVPEILRGVFHGAMAVYLDRFLNVPPAALPGERHTLDDEPRDAAELRSKLLTLLDSRNRVEECARVVARYVSLGHASAALIDTLAFAVMREDFDFHTLQVLEAGVRLYQELEGRGDAARNVLVAVTRNIAAHSPTQRASFQTATIALRLHRGEKLYEEEA